MSTSNQSESSRNLLRQPRPTDLTRLTPGAIADASEMLEKLTAGSNCREEAANRIANYMFESFRSGSEPACALVRCFQTCSLESLPPERHAFASRRLGPISPRGNIRCLTLLATRGTQPQWNSVAGSVEHQAIPLPSVEVILRAPMIARLLLQMGIRYERVIEPPAERPGFLIEDTADSFNIFHVEHALGSPYIPAQASFVHPYAIRSVLGFGGLFPDGELFAFILFTRVTITTESAKLFRTLARSAKLALAPFPPGKIFLAA